MKNFFGVMPAGLRGHRLARIFAEQNQPGGIMLPDHHFGQHRGEHAAIKKFVSITGAKIHRAAGIEKDLAAEISVVLELLDIKLVRAGPYFPINVAQVVALSVGAVSGELGAIA
jgi:hypothetical protein